MSAISQVLTSNEPYGRYHYSPKKTRESVLLKQQVAISILSSDYDCKLGRVRNSPARMTQLFNKVQGWLHCKFENVRCTEMVSM